MVIFAVLLAGLLPALWLALAPPPASRQGQIPAMNVGLLAGGLSGSCIRADNCRYWHPARLPFKCCHSCFCWYCRPPLGPDSGFTLPSR